MPLALHQYERYGRHATSLVTSSPETEGEARKEEERARRAMCVARLPHAAAQLRLLPAPFELQALDLRWEAVHDEDHLNRPQPSRPLHTESGEQVSIRMQKEPLSGGGSAP